MFSPLRATPVGPRPGPAFDWVLGDAAEGLDLDLGSSITATAGAWTKRVRTPDTPRDATPAVVVPAVVVMARLSGVRTPPILAGQMPPRRRP